jgi:hypothetical protein
MNYIKKGRKLVPIIFELIDKDCKILKLPTKKARYIIAYSMNITINIRNLTEMEFIHNAFFGYKGSFTLTRGLLFDNSKPAVLLCKDKNNQLYSICSKEFELNYPTYFAEVKKELNKLGNYSSRKHMIIMDEKDIINEFFEVHFPVIEDYSKEKQETVVNNFLETEKNRINEIINLKDFTDLKEGSWIVINSREGGADNWNDPMEALADRVIQVREVSTYDNIYKRVKFDEETKYCWTTEYNHFRMASEEEIVLQRKIIKDENLSKNAETEVIIV